MQSSQNNTTQYYSRFLREKHGLSHVWNLPTEETSHVQAADIDWTFDLTKYQSRLVPEVRSSTALDRTNLPRDWPFSVKLPPAWDGASFKDEKDYVYFLTEQDKSEIRNAIAYFKALTLDLRQVQKSTFPLPTIGPVLERLSNDLHYGKGFILVRGIEPREFSREDNVILYLGVSSYIAERRGRQGRQSDQGHMLAHITDLNNPDESVQSTYRNVAQPFHNDVFCDVLAMYCLSPAAEGGDSSISSTSQIYNELASQRPDVINALSRRDWVFNTGCSNPPYIKRPILYYEAGRPILSFSRYIITGSPWLPKFPQSPPISESQAEALDLLQMTAMKNALSIRYAAGDLVFLNNLAVLHSRDSFRDSPGCKRYFIRLWLRNDEKAWSLPADLKLASDRVFENATSDDEIWELDPYLKEQQSKEYSAADGDGEGGSSGGGGQGGGQGGGGSAGGNGRSTHCG